jgi:DNA-binding MarR family transcriptional regulator
MASSSAELFRRFTRSVFGAQAALLKHGDVANAQFGQSSARWRVLHQISAGQSSVADIARSTGYSRQGVQRLADALVGEGSARYTADETDRRKQRLELTEAGASTFDRLEAHFDGWAERLLAHIPEADLVAVSKALEHITYVVAADIDYMKSKET